MRRCGRLLDACACGLGLLVIRARCRRAKSRTGPGRRRSRCRGPATERGERRVLERSRSERTAGDFTAAAVSVERALRIEPNNPSLWIELAEIKAAEGDRDQAEMIARKALTLAGSDRSIRERADRLL